jgi:hypothetical protein
MAFPKLSDSKDSSPRTLFIKCIEVMGFHPIGSVTPTLTREGGGKC